MDGYFNTRDLSVGYHGNVLIHDINIRIEKGKILTLIGPNGAGKSTILKSITRHLRTIGGTVTVENRDVAQWSVKEMAKQMAVVLTERIRPELMSCRDVVAMGRYPYTNMMGRLTREDQQAVEEALSRVHGEALADQDFMTLSDGQKQRIMLARAICQDPQIIVLDEPTAYLDIRHKVELLDILRQMAREKNITVIMSLHEIDLATRISDYLLCVKGDTIERFGPPEEILQQDTIEKLYDLPPGSYNLLFGSVELRKPAGRAQVFVVGGGGFGIRCYRTLQKKNIPFAAGILYENDVDFPVARVLAEQVISAPAFQPVEEDLLEKAQKLLKSCGRVVNAGAPIGPYNQFQQALLKLAEEEKIPVLSPDQI